MAAQRTDKIISSLVQISGAKIVLLTVVRAPMREAIKVQMTTASNHLYPPKALPNLALSNAGGANGAVNPIKAVLTTLLRITMAHSFIL